MSKAVVVCPECGAGLVNLVSGALCPNGCHGVLQPKLSAEANRANVRAYQIAQLPRAVHMVGWRDKKGGFADCRMYVLVGGDAGRLVYRRVPRMSQSLNKCPEDHLLASLDGRAIELIPFVTHPFGIAAPCEMVLQLIPLSEEKKGD